MAETLISLLPYSLLGVLFAIANYVLAGRLGKNRALWVVLSLIPVVNFFFYFWVWYSVAIKVLDDLRAIKIKIGADNQN
jgi:hypothetical protein